MMSNIEILEKIMADRCLSPLEFGRKIGKNDNFVSLIRSGRTKKFTAPVLRKLMEQFPEYSAEWLSTGEPPIYASEVMSGNKAGGDILGHHATKSVGDELVAAIAALTEAARVNADTINKQAETIAQLLKHQQQ